MMMLIVEYKGIWDHFDFIMLNLILLGEIRVCNVETWRTMTNTDGPKYGPILKNLKKFVLKKREKVGLHRKYITFGSFCQWGARM